MESLPAGLAPSDKNIEFFADPTHFGKLFWVSEGVVHNFRDLPLHILDDLRDELLSDTRALTGMRMMGITDESEQIEQYNYCNRGKLSSDPDITITGKKKKEYVDCGRRGHCPAENKICSQLMINGSKITHRELQCLKLIGVGLPYKIICTEMGFRRETAVVSLIYRLRDKLQCSNQTEIAIKVREVGLI